MHKVLASVVCCFALGTVTAPASEPIRVADTADKDDKPAAEHYSHHIGFLGVKPGETVAVEGKRHAGVMVGNSELLIDTVNGKKLAKPHPITVEGVSLPKDARIKLRGYEARASKEAIAAFGRRSAPTAPTTPGELPDDIGPSVVVGLDPQGMLLEWFVAVAVIEPATLKLHKEK